MGTSHLTGLIDRYKDAHGVSDAELARRIGMSRENLRLWRSNGLRRLPDRENLAAVARTIGEPYRRVLSAALFDTGYVTDGDTATVRPHAEVLYDAITVLTEATRLTNQPMRQAVSGGWEPDPEPRAALPIDWAEFVTRALAGAAANVGGIEQILSGRGGSWEAEVVRQALVSTVGGDDELLRHRTEPVIVDLWVEQIFASRGDWRTEDAYRESELELEVRADAVPEPNDLPPGPFAADDPRITAAHWVSVDEQGYLLIRYDTGEWSAEDHALFEQLRAEADAHRPPTAGEIAYDAAVAKILELEEALAEQKDREYRDYADRLSEAIRARLATLELRVPVAITIALRPAEADEGARAAHTPPDCPRNKIEEAIEAALDATTTPADLPGTPLDRVTGHSKSTS